MKSASLLDDVRAERFRAWRNRERPSAAWGRRYDIDEPTFTRAGQFLTASLDFHHHARQKRQVMWAVAPAAIVGAFALVWLYVDSVNERHNKELVEKNHLSNSLYVASMLNTTGDVGASWYDNWSAFVRREIAADVLKGSAHYEQWAGEQKNNLHMASELLAVTERPKIKDLHRLIGHDPGDKKPSERAQKKPVYRIAVNAEATRFAIGVRDTIHVFNSDWARIGRPAKAKLDFDQPGTSLFFGADGKTLVFLNRQERSLRRLHDSANFPALPPGKIAVAQDGSQIAVVHRRADAKPNEWHVTLVDPLRPDRRRQFEISGGGSRLSKVAVNRNDTILLAFDDTYVGAWDTANQEGAGARKPLWHLATPVAVTKSTRLNLSDDAAWLALTQGRIVHAWDIEGLRKSGRLDGRINSPDRTSWRPGGDGDITVLRFLVSGDLLTISKRGIMRLWPYRTNGAPLRVVHSPNSLVGVSARRSGVVIAIDSVGQSGPELKRYDLRQPMWGRPLPHAFDDRRITRAVLHRDASIVAVGFKDGSIMLFRPHFELHKKFRLDSIPIATTDSPTDNPSPVVALGISDDGRVVTGIRKDGGVLTLVRAPAKPHSGYTARLIHVLPSPVRNAAFSKDGMWAAAVVEDGKVSLLQRTSPAGSAVWRNTSGKPFSFAHRSPVCGLAFDDTGTEMAFGTADGHILRVRRDKVGDGISPRVISPFKSDTLRRVASIAFGARNDIMMALSALRSDDDTHDCKFGQQDPPPMHVSLVRDRGSFSGGRKSYDLVITGAHSATMLPDSNTAMLTAYYRGIIVGLYDFDHLRLAIETRGHRRFWDHHVRRFDFALANALGDTPKFSRAETYAATMGCRDSECFMLTPTGDAGSMAIIPFERRYDRNGAQIRRDESARAALSSP